MGRRVVIFFIVVVSYLSSFLVGKSDNQLFLRPLSSRNMAYHVVLGTASPSAQQSFFHSQVKELSIGAQKATTGEWGKAQQVAAHNGTAQEILSALNTYRQKNGRGTLTWNDTLANYAQLRANGFFTNGKLDEHVGFKDYLHNQDGFHKLGFASLGENSSYGYTLEAIHLIERVYAGDKPHDDNQLDSKWGYVGIGVAGNATDLVFAGQRM